MWTPDARRLNTNNYLVRFMKRLGFGLNMLLENVKSLHYKNNIKGTHGASNMTLIGPGQT